MDVFQHTTFSNVSKDEFEQVNVYLASYKKYI